MIYIMAISLIFVGLFFLQLVIKVIKNLSIIVGAPTRRGSDASHLNLPLPKKLQAQMNFFSSQGFVRLGESEVKLPFQARPAYEWKFVSAEQTITLHLVEIAPKGMLLASRYPDGAFLETQFPFGERIDTHDFHSHTITTDLDSAYQYHLQQMKVFGKLHGEPVKIENMRDSMQSDEIYRQNHISLKFRRNLWISLLTLLFPAYALVVSLVAMLNFRWEHITEYEINSIVLLLLKAFFPSILIFAIFTYLVDWSYRRELHPSENSKEHQRQGLRLLFLLLLVITSTVYLFKPNSVDQNYRQAVRALKAEEYQYAINYSNQVIWADPENGPAHQLRGVAHLNLQETEPAINDLTRAIELDNKDADTYLFRGLAYESQLRYEEAIVDYDEHIRLEPDSSMGFFARGAAYYEIAEYNKAIRDFEKIIQIGIPTNVRVLGDVYYRKGLAYLALKDDKRAIMDFSEAIFLDPNNSLAYYSRALIYYSQNKYSEAITDLDNATKIDPLYMNAFYLRGVTYAAKGDYAQAIIDYSMALDLDPMHENSYYGRAIAYEQLGDIEQAIGDYKVIFRITADLELQKKIEGILQKLEK